MLSWLTFINNQFIMWSFFLQTPPPLHNFYIVIFILNLFTKICWFFYINKFATVLQVYIYHLIIKLFHNKDPVVSYCPIQIKNVTILCWMAPSQDGRRQMIMILNWLSNSLDLRQIENPWNIMKRKASPMKMATKEHLKDRIKTAIRSQH